MDIPLLTFFSNNTFLISFGFCAALSFVLAVLINLVRIAYSSCILSEATFEKVKQLKPSVRNHLLWLLNRPLATHFFFKLFPDPLSDSHISFCRFCAKQYRYGILGRLLNYGGCGAPVDSCVHADNFVGIVSFRCCFEVNHPLDGNACSHCHVRFPLEKRGDR